MNANELVSIIASYLHRLGQTKDNNQPRSYGRIEKYLLILGLVGFIIFCVFIVYRYLPVHVDANPPVTWWFGIDWKGCLRTDIIQILSGNSPYKNGCGLNPPWTYLILSPLTMVTPALGSAIMFVLTYFGYGFMLYRLNFKPIISVLFLFTPFVFINAVNGNIDWLAVIGYVLPAPIGLFFVMMKPQLGVGIAIYWMVEAWRKGGIKQVLITFVPVTIAYLISFVIYGFWPLGLTRMPDDAYNASIFPWGIPVALVLLWLAIRKTRPPYAIAATPFLAPYINFHSYAVTLIAVNANPITMAIIVLLLWGV